MNAGDGSAQTAWSYDARGRVTQQTDVIAGVGSYATSWSYNSADRVTSMTYPSGEVVNYTHLLQGGVSQVTSSRAAYLTGAGYDASGRVLERSLGNTVKNTWSYNDWNVANKGGRLKTAQASKTATPTNYIQNLSYSNYDKVGNLTGLSDYAVSENLTFTYDALNRLDAVSGAYSDNPEYDPRGNLSQKKKLDGTLVSLSYPTDPTDPTPARPHAALSMGSNTFQYDANGSMTQRVVGGVTYTLTYDIQNRLTAISGGGLSATYMYNADGARVKSVVTTGGVTRTTGYVGDYFEISLGQPKASGPGGTLPNCALPRHCVFFPMVNSGLVLYPGQAWYSYYYAGASRIALRIKSNQLNLDDGVFYFLSDHLGGTAITLDANGVKTAELRYTAWGETRYTSGSTPTQRRYTGQLQAEAGLYFYNARWYDPALGRFAQADTIVPQPGSSKAWDRYAYVNNNPVRYNDPSGHMFKDDQDSRAGDTELIRDLIAKKNMVLIETVKNGSIDDLEAFAQLVDYAAWFTPNCTSCFVQNLGSVLTGDTGASAWVTEVMGQMDNSKWDKHYKSRLQLGQSGFASIFQDPGAGGSQPHHFWFYVDGIPAKSTQEQCSRFIPVVGSNWS